MRNLVLVVEDDPDLRTLLVECLTEEFSLDSAGNADAGIRAAEQLRPDLIICGYNMPGQNGLHLIRTLRNDPRHSHVPVILISGQTQPEESLPLGVVFLPKPFPLETLLEAVRSALPMAHSAAA